MDGNWRPTPTSLQRGVLRLLASYVSFHPLRILRRPLGGCRWHLVCPSLTKLRSCESYRSPMRSKCALNSPRSRVAAQSLRRVTYSRYGCVTDRQGLTLSSRGMAKATWKPHLSNAAEPNGYSPVAALQRSLAGGLWPFKLLSGVIRPEKLGIDPTLQAIALHLDPVPLPVCNLEPRAFAGGPNNSPVSRWRRPDVYARTL